MMKRNKLIFVGVICVVIAILACAYVIQLASGLSPMFKENQDFSNQRKIAEAIVEFMKTNNGNFPSNIEELVKAGLLPQYSSQYASPYDGNISGKISYNDSSYRIISPRDDRSVRFYIQRKSRGTNVSWEETGYVEISGIINDAIRKYQRPVRQSQP